MKKYIVLFSLSGIFSCIIFLFWYKQWIYNLPTPIPSNYISVQRGEHIDLAGKFQFDERPVFLHFFNPDCPCSRFNTAHFKLLLKEYGDKINFAVVVLTKDKSYSATSIADKFDFSVPVIMDSSLAKQCGVYSTPQAVLLDNKHCIYYRGNYNRTRYCTDKRTNYAQMAIQSLLSSADVPQFDQYALKAYGCSLPNCKK